MLDACWRVALALHGQRARVGQARATGAHAPCIRAGWGEAQVAPVMHHALLGGGPQRWPPPAVACQHLRAGRVCDWSPLATLVSLGSELWGVGPGSVVPSCPQLTPGTQ